MAREKEALLPTNKQWFIRQKAAENRHEPEGQTVLWSRHATIALVDEDLGRADVEAALEHCRLIEDYPTAHRPLPDCLVLGILPQGGPVHAVVAIDEENDRIFVVTVYLPTPERWDDDWQTRR